MTNPYVWRTLDNKWMARVANERSETQMAVKAVRSIRTALVARDLADNDDRIDVVVVGEVAPGFRDFTTLNRYLSRDAPAMPSLQVWKNAILAPGIVASLRVGVVRLIGAYSNDFLVLGVNRYGSLRAHWVNGAFLTPTTQALPFRIPEVGDHVEITDCTQWHSMPMYNVVRVVSPLDPASLEVEVFGRDNNGRFSRQGISVNDLTVTDEPLTHPSTTGRSLLAV
jgi:hypothetical protein